MMQAWVRLFVTLIVLFNESLVIAGKNPLPFSEGSIYEGVSSVAAVIVILWAWYKNNNISPEAKEAQKYLENLKNKRGV